MKSKNFNLASTKHLILMNHNHFVDAPRDLQLYSHVMFADDGEFLIEADSDKDARRKALQLVNLLDLAPVRSEYKAIQEDCKYG